MTEDCGMLVPPDDVDALANAMEKMIATFTSYDASDMHKQIADNFGFEAFGKRLKFIYEEGTNKHLSVCIFSIVLAVINC